MSGTHRVSRVQGTKDIYLQWQEVNITIILLNEPQNLGALQKIQFYVMVHLHSEMVKMFNEYFFLAFLLLKMILFQHCSPLVIDTLVITPQFVLSKLTNLESGKSPGPDGWPTELIKSTADLICFPLSLLYNKSLTNSVLQNDWKKSICYTFTLKKTS